MISTLMEGLSLGLVTGTTCLATCSPIYLPYLLSENNSIRKSFIKITEISIGRFISYIAFGALAGYSGSKIGNKERIIFTSIAYILLSIFLFLNTFRLTKKAKKCSIPFYAKITQSAFFLGILTGINFCPSFLIALSKAIELHGAFNGIYLFIGFFIGTTIFLIPLAFASGLTFISKIKVLAKYFSVLIAIWFLFQGVTGLIKFYTPHKLDPNKRIIDIFAPNKDLIIISSQENINYFKTLKDSLSKYTAGKINLYTEISFPKGKLKVDQPIFLDKNFKDNNKFDLNNQDIIYVETNYKISPMINYLKTHVFKTKDKLRWEFHHEH